MRACAIRFDHFVRFVSQFWYLFGLCFNPYAISDCRLQDVIIADYTELISVVGENVYNLRMENGIMLNWCAIFSVVSLKLYGILIHCILSNDDATKLSRPHF